MALCNGAGTRTLAFELTVMASSSKQLQANEKEMKTA